MTTTKPANVVEALALVMADLPGIGKGGQAAPQQGGYRYRGIDQITREVQPLLATYGVVIVPSVDRYEVKDIVVQGKPWTDTYLTVSWRIFGPGDSQVQACTVGIGRDNADKGSNKAMTQAFKYLLMDMLCISDPKDDTDGVHAEADAPIPTISTEEVAQFLGRIKALKEETQAELKERWSQTLPPLARLTVDDVDEAEHLLTEYENKEDEAAQGVEL